MMTMSIVESSSSVEALAFNYSRFGVLVLLNNIWTLVAVATAAVSFWKLKFLPSLARRRFRNSSAADTQFQHVISSPSAATAAETVIPPCAAAVESGCGGGDDDDDFGVVKGGRVYRRLCFDDVVVSQNEEGGDKGLVTSHGGKTLRFDVLERLRLSDLGVYNHQDLKVLDGNVVKLWEGCSSPRAAVRSSVQCRQMRLG